MTRPLSVTANGNAKVSTAQSKFGGASAEFDGTGDYLGVTQTLSGDFTFECWIRPDRVTGENYILRVHNSSDTFQYVAGILNSKVYTFRSGTTSGTTTLSTATWYHFAFVRASGTSKIYLNGTEELSRGNTLNLTDAKIYIGGFTNNLGTDGFLDEIRISSVARYTGNFTAPTAPFINDSDTLLLLHCDGTNNSTTFTDDNGSGRSRVGVSAVGNAQVDTAQSKFGGASAYFDGTGDYLDIYTSVGASDFTIELQYRPTARNGSYPPIISAVGSSFNANGEWGLYDRHNDANTKFRFYWREGGSFQYLESDTTVSNGTWYHIAIARSSSTLKLFVNGTEEDSTTTSQAFNNSNAIHIGREGSNYVNGHVDEVRLSDSARYTANFTAPTAAFSNDSNTLLLLHMDGTDGSTYFEDDNEAVGVTHEGDADLVSEATVSATGLRIQPLSADFGALFTPVVTASALINQTAILNSVIDISIVAEKITDTSVDLTASSTMSIDNSRIRDLSSDLENNITVWVEGDRFANAVIDLTDVFNTTLSADAFKNHTAILETVFDVAVIIDKILSAESTISSEFSIFAITDQTITGSADLVAESTATATALRIQELASDAVVEATVNAIAEAILDGQSDLNSIVESVVIGDKIVGFASDAASEFANVTVADRIRDDAADMQVEFAQTVEVLKIISLAADITDAFAATLSAEAFKNHTAILETATDLSATASRTRDNDVALENIVNLSSQGNITADATLMASAVTELYCLPFNVQFADSVISSEFTTSANAIEYIRKINAPSSTTTRPWATSYISQNLTTEEAPAFDAVTKKFGSHSLRLRQDDGGVNPPGNSYVRYHSNSDVARLPQTGDALHIEFWVRGEGQLVDARDGNTSRWRITHSQFVFQISSNNYVGINLTLQSGQFNHIVVRIEPNLVKVYVNGSLAGSSTSSLNTNGVNSLTFGDDDFYGTNLTDGYFYLDEFRIIRGTASDVDAETGYAISSNTATVPTQPYTSTANTKILLHWDNSYQDDLYGVQLASSGLSSVATIQASAGKDVKASSNLSTAFVNTANVDKIIQFSADLVSEFNQTITEDYLRFAAADLNTEFDIQTIATVNRLATADLVALCEFTAEIERIQSASADLPAIATQLTAAAKIGDFLIAADSVFSIAAEATKTVDANITATTDTAQVTVADRIRDFTLDVNSEFTLNADANIITNTSCDAVSIALFASEGLRIKSLDSSISAEFTFDSDGIISVSAESNTFTAFGIFVSGDRTRFGVSDVQSLSEFSADARLFKDHDAALVSEFAQTTANDRIRDNNSELPAIATQLTVAAKTGSVLVAMDNTVNCTVDAEKITDTLADLQSAAEFGVEYLRRRSFALETASEFDISIEPITVSVASADLQILTALVSEGVANFAGSSALNATTTVTAQGLLSASGASELNTVAELQLSATVTALAGADLNTEFGIAATAGILADATANLPAISSILAVARAVQSSRVIYVIPRETRIHAIGRENRSYAISRETRTHRIQGEK